MVAFHFLASHTSISVAPVSPLAPFEQFALMEMNPYYTRIASLTRDPGISGTHNNAMSMSEEQQMNRQSRFQKGAPSFWRKHIHADPETM
jgi:hypothetical protein